MYCDQFDTILQRRGYILSILRHLRYQWPLISLRGHLRSLIFAPMKSAYTTSYWTSRVTLVLSCRVWEILQHLCAESHFLRTPLLFGRKFQGVSLGVNPWRLVCKERTSQANWSWNYFWRIPTYVITIHQRHRRTDRRTDGQTDRQTYDMRSQYRALHLSASRGKNRSYRILAAALGAPVYCLWLFRSRVVL